MCKIASGIGLLQCVNVHVGWVLFTVCVIACMPAGDKALQFSHSAWCCHTAL
jgi:hypothetical protein